MSMSPVARTRVLSAAPPPLSSTHSGRTVTPSPSFSPGSGAQQQALRPADFLQPATHAYRFASCALMTVVALLAATWGSHIMRAQPAIAGGLALFVALGAAMFLVAAWSASWQLRHAWRYRRYSALRIIAITVVRALGSIAALAVLIVGGIRAAGLLVPHASLQWAINLSSSAAVPAAALMLLVAGLSQLPWQAWVPATFLTLSSAATACWTLTSEHAAVALLAAAGCLVCTVWCAWRWHCSPLLPAFSALLPRWQSLLARFIIGAGAAICLHLSVVALLAESSAINVSIGPWLILEPVLAGAAVTTGVWVLTSGVQRGCAIRVSSLE